MNAERNWPDLPLIELFVRLRLAGLPLGIDEYQLLVRALHRGFGSPNRAALARLCKMLWIKSVEEERLFDYHFAALFPALAEDTPVIEPEEKGDVLPWASVSDEPGSSPPPLTFEEPNISMPTTSPDLVLAFGDDEAQVAQALKQISKREDMFDDEPLPQADEYFPITRRQMKQAWRYLRRPQRLGPAVELDIEATVSKIARTGVFLEPVLVPQRINRAVLFLLIDQGGSMVPFHMLSQRLAETAIRGGKLGQANVFYFHNCPTDYLYHDPFQLDAEDISNVLNRLPIESTMVLIFSDAGAARGAFNETRIEWTVQFLEKLKQYVRSVAWLNPMPHSRWLGTTAGEIMHFVPMLDVSRRGLDHAINILRGRPAPYELKRMRIL
ncbi:MAG TPA: hypothetical protein VFV38_40140 [Ktedonobacteraceae bacterium]|nr:hypothetical protein [Ktedonobacteraceae bacterium]